MTSIKVCGVTCVEDAVAIGAMEDVRFIGLNFWRGSRRYVRPEVAAAIVEAMPRDIIKVGVFVDASETDVRKILSTVWLDWLQFHGDESPGFCRRFGVPHMKAFRLRDASVLTRIPDFLDDAETPFLVDAYVPDAPGGTGATVSLELARRARALGRRMMLAGGLTAENVANAIDVVAPWAVDVASGVELPSGRKDPARIAAFITAVQSPR